MAAIDDGATYEFRMRVVTDYDTGYPTPSFTVAGEGAQAITRSIVDALGLTDSVEAVTGKAISVTIVDSLGLTDSVEAVVPKAITRTIVDALGITDSVRLAAITAFVEQLTLSDAVTASKAISIALVDALGITDSVETAAGKAITRTIVDSLGLTDAVEADTPKAITVSIVDSLGITDTVESDVIEVIEILLPSIDGATTPPGFVSLASWDAATGERVITPQSIDGASAPPGPVSLHSVPTVLGEPDPPPVVEPVPPGEPFLSGTTIPEFPGDDSYGGPDPADPPKDVRVRLFSSTGTPIGWLDNATNVEWQDPLNEVGFGRFSLPLDDPLADDITTSSEIRCYLYGVLAFTFIVETAPTRDAISPGEEAAQQIDVSGRGRVSLSDRAQVLPVKGVSDPLVPQHRLFSFASPDFPNASDWGFASVGLPQGEIDPNRAQFIEYTTVLRFEDDITETLLAAAPIGWQIPQAFWIWGTDDTTPEGFNYFRRTVKLTSEWNIRIAATGDNLYTLYMDGLPLIGDDQNSQCWTEHKQVSMTLPPGTYTFAAAVENLPWPPEFYNPSGFLFALYPVDANGDTIPIGVDGVAQFFARSDGGWRALPYPSQQPGWTPGQIVRQLIDEAIARGTLTSFTVDFTDEADSNGNQWNGSLDAGSFIPGFSVPIGASVLDALDSLVDAGWVEYRVKPGGKVLQLFNPDTAPTSAATYSQSASIATQTIVSQSFSPQSAPVNVLLVKWPFGYLTVEDAASRAAFGTFEGSVSIDADSRSDAVRQARVLLNDVAFPRSSVVMEIDPVDDDEKPYISYGPGDRVVAPNETGSPTSYRVLAISVADDGVRPRIALELDTRLNRREIDKLKLIQALGSGVVGNTRVRNALATTSPVAR